MTPCHWGVFSRLSMKTTQIEIDLATEWMNSLGAEVARLLVNQISLKHDIPIGHYKTLFVIAYRLLNKTIK